MCVYLRVCVFSVVISGADSSVADKASLTEHEASRADAATSQRVNVFTSSSLTTSPHLGGRLNYVYMILTITFPEGETSSGADGLQLRSS